MPIISDFNSRPEDVGEILVKVQEDLHQLRERLLVQGDGNTSGIDISALENAIQKTEQGIKTKTEQVLQQLNNRVLTLPNLEAQRLIDPRATVETTWDLRANTQPEVGFRQGMPTTMTKSIQNMNRPDLPRRPVISLRKAVNKDPHILEGNQMQGPTPAQDFKEHWNERVITNPYNPKNREVLSDNYGIQLPLIEDKKGMKSINQIVLRGSTIEPLAVLPRANRVDPQLLPPPITEEDARRGILSLIERGLIPPAADLTLDPSPVRQTLLQLHDPRDKEPLGKAPILDDGDQYRLAGIKLDPNPPQRTETDMSMVLAPQPPSRPSASPDMKSRASSGRRTAGTKLKTPVTVKTLELQPMEEQGEFIEKWGFIPKPPPTTPASAPDLKDRSHRFAIQNGRVRENTAEFMAFKQHYCLSWGSIVTMMKHMEKLLTNYAVPIAFINGDKLADLSLEFELEHPPTMNDMLSVIVNREDVENIIRRPGQRYQGPAGEHVAAARIQSTYRMYRERTKYLEYRHKKWAAGVIAISWVMNVKMAKVRKQLGVTRSDQLENFRVRARNFAKKWDRIQSSRRTIIHIPSLGYGQNIRESINEFSIFQNMQMGRLCDLEDPNVDVIYVSPVPVNEEMMQYYAKLLGLKGAIETGNVEDQADLSTRYKIIVPEAVQSFPTHRMCLSSHLKYSPRTMKRIKNLIRGREAFIVTGVPHKDDLHVADMLDIPILCPEPEVAHLYSTKSGSKRIFASANVSVPPGEYDVYSLPQLHECLAQLITENLEVTRWLFKLDDEFDGRGIAYIDVAKHLRCYPWALKEAHRYGEKWTKKWAQEAAYIKIHAEIPEVLANCAQPVNKKAYPNWQKYMEAFLSQGGVIEACPPSDSVTALTVDMSIEPNGRISMQCMGDQIHAETPFSCWGLSVPQSSVEPEQLNDAAFKIGEACKARGVIGYFAVDFVTFIHPKTMQQMLWAVDLNLSYSDSLSMYRLIQFVTEGSLNVKTHYFDIPTPKKEEKKGRRRRQKEEEVDQRDYTSESDLEVGSGVIGAENSGRAVSSVEPPPNTSRFAVMSTRLHHTNLSVVHYSVFFQMCRAHGIGYDIKEKQGTVFTLIDSFNRENLGMVTVGDNLQGALATFARNLSVIHQEISAPNMQGDSNFKHLPVPEGILGRFRQYSECTKLNSAELIMWPVIEDIEAILGMTVQNAEDASEVTDTSVTDG